MSTHRISLDDQDLEIIVAALTARLAGLSGERRQHTKRLMQRLDNGGRGNPRLTLTAYAECVHGLSLGAQCDRCLQRTRAACGLPLTAGRTTSQRATPAEARPERPAGDV